MRLYFILLLLPFLAKGQTADYMVNPSDYLDTTIYERTFSRMYKEYGDDFKFLKSYWKDKQEVLKYLQDESSMYRFQVASLDYWTTGIEEVIKRQKEASKSVEVFISISEVNTYTSEYCRIKEYRPAFCNAEKIQIGDLKNIVAFYKNEKAKSEAINKSIFNLKKDITACEDAIDSALNPVKDTQRFRAVVTSVFGFLVFILMFFFFATIWKTVNDAKKNHILNSNGLQFMTLFIIIITILLFGILEISEGSELVPIISAIAGYVLGNEASKKTEKQEKQEKEEPNLAEKQKSNPNTDPKAEEKKADEESKETKTT